jgi:hypothetical protein
MKKNFIVIYGISVIAILELIALCKGIDGIALSSSVGGISLIAGYWWKKIKG